MARKNWSREELILAFNLYLKLNFGQMHNSNPEVKHLAKIIGRTTGAITMRLGNFATVDPYHQQRGVGGLPGGRKQVEPIWNEFINNKEELLFESERILAQYEHKTIEEKFAEDLKDLSNYKGETKIREVKTRVNQNIFRQIIVANYANKCAITGINIPSLLVASHIVPWSDDVENRLNPQNGLCLNALHDKAFDKYLITITPSYKLKVSKKLKADSKNKSIQDNFLQFEEREIILPIKSLPDEKLLLKHNKLFAQRN